GKSGWSFGLSDLWIVAGNAFVGSFLAWKLFARRTRCMTNRLKAITMPQFLSARYQSPKMKIFSALIIFIFLVPYSSSVYVGLSYFLNIVLDIPYEVSLFCIAGVTAFYLVLGGYFAVALTDFFLGILMILGVGAMLFFVVNSPQVGGLMNVVPALKAVDPVLTSPFGPDKWALFSLVFLTSVGTWGLPQMTQKFYAVKNEKVIKTATWVTFFLCAWIAFGAYFNGALCRLFFPSLDAVGGNVDMLVPTMVSQVVPDLVLVMILLLVLSASMSTLASLVLVSSSAVAVDLMSIVKPDMKKSSVVLWMRILCLVFIGLSLYLALNPNAIVSLMSFSWGAVAGSFLA
ncbi:MAG: sodium:solute symporter, partial [Clostridiales bacterium]